jgi:hypothetical protein
MGTRALIASLVFCVSAAWAAEVVVDGRDSPAIARAIDLSEAGDTIRLPAGRYDITEPIRPKSGTRLLGEGQDRTIVRFAATAAGSIVLLTGVEGVEVADLTLDGAGDPLALQGVYATSSSQLSIHDLTIRDLVKGEGFGPHAIHFNGRNPTREAGQPGSGVTDSVIADCTIENIGLGASFGSGIRASWGSSRNRIEGNTIRNTGRGGIFGDNGSTDLVIRDNRVAGSGGEGLGIEVWGGCDRSVIEDNTIDHWLSVGGCDYCAVRRNVVSDEGGTTKPYGLEIIGSYCVVSDNVVDHGQGIGISVSNRDPKNYHLYLRNTISRCYHWGAQLQGEEEGIAYHYFYDCEFLETLVGHEAVVYKGGEGNGFRTNGNVTHVVLEDCEFSGNGRYGVQLGGQGIDALSFIRCRIADNDGSAVVGPGEYTALEWTDCTVEGNASDALPPEKPFDSQPPTPVITAAQEAVVGETVTLSVEADGINTAIWDLGDGPTVTGPRVEHPYARPGVHRVTVVVWDEEGRGGRAEQELRVREAQ